MGRYLFTPRRVSRRGMDPRLLDALVKRGALADLAALEFLSKAPDPVAVLDRVFLTLEDVPLVLTLDHIRVAEMPLVPEAIQKAHLIARRAAEVLAPATPPKLRGLATARDVSEDFRVLRDITGASTCEGTLQDFSRYFAHRLKTIGGMLRARRELVGAVEIARVRKLSREVRFIGMVSEVRTTKRGDRVIEVEDDTDTAPVFVPQGADLFKDNVLADEVIGVIGRPTEKGLVIAAQIVRPDVPAPRAFPATKEGIGVAFVSDIHVGSKTFLAEKWAAFGTWLNAGDELARSLRYLVLVGDVVDGIGVYPR